MAVRGLHGLKLQSGGPTSPYILMLVFSRMLKSLGLFSAVALLKTVSPTTLVFLSLSCAAVVYVLLQRPFGHGRNRTRLRGSDLPMILRHSILTVVYHGLYTAGLSSCGPLRTIILAEYTDWALLALVSLVAASPAGSSASAGHYRTRCALIGVVAVSVLLVFDDPASGHSVGHHEEQPQSVIVPEHALGRVSGMLMLLAASAIGMIRQSVGKKIGAKIGGVKRLNAVSTVGAALLAAAIARGSHVSLTPNHASHGMPHAMASLAAYVIFGQVLAYYTDGTVTARVSQYIHSSIGLFAAFVACGFLESLWERDEVVEASTIVATVLILAGQHHWHVSRSYGGSGVSSSRGSIIGYAPDGLPLYASSNASLGVGQSAFRPFVNFMRTVGDSSETRALLRLLCLNFVVMLAELIVGQWTNSLAVISDGFHTLFTCATILVAMMAAVTSKWKPTRTSSYGYGRAEVLSVYSICVVLVVVALCILWEGIHRLNAPPSVSPLWLLSMAGVSLAVNLLGVIVLRPTKSVSGKRASQTAGGAGAPSPNPRLSLGRSRRHYTAPSPPTNRRSLAPSSPADHQIRKSFGHDEARSPGNLGTAEANGARARIISGDKLRSRTNSSAGETSTTSTATLQAVYLHVASGTIGSVGVLMSALLVDYLGWRVADALCAIVIALLILSSAGPLLQATSGILLNRVPASLPPQHFRESLTRIKSLEGVTACREVHFWCQAGSSIIGTMHIIVTQGTNDQRILSQVTALLRELGVTDLAVQVEIEGGRISKGVGQHDSKADARPSGEVVKL